MILQLLVGSSHWVLKCVHGVEEIPNNIIHSWVGLRVMVKCRSQGSHALFKQVGRGRGKHFSVHFGKKKSCWMLFINEFESQTTTLHTLLAVDWPLTASVAYRSTLELWLNQKHTFL